MKTADQLIKELNALTYKHKDYYAFMACAEMDELINEWVKCAREQHGIERPEAYRRWLKVCAMNYEHRHSKTMWKAFYLRKDGERKRLMAYSMHGEGRGEERATIELLAYENGCGPDAIEVECEYKPTQEERIA